MRKKWWCEMMEKRGGGGVLYGVVAGRSNVARM
jgi:hypothetical protein